MTTKNLSDIEKYDAVVKTCRDVFEKKMQDYGTSWRHLRPESLTDQIYIKAKRLKTIDTLKQQKVKDKPEDEWIGIINYCIIALIQLDLKDDDRIDLSAEEVLNLYDQKTKIVKDLMLKKNHDYGDAWKDMRISSLIDLVLVKLHRIKQIEDNQGKTLVSEGVEANYMDIINYSIFALIKLKFS
ncbi:MAG: hypothetical protein KatS3mg027_1019 [Bacteroidia bacterium]|nr:MAG: hypothetical protein KatS3mg027_1019 [Bacteroidia bacterium]